MKTTMHLKKLYDIIRNDAIETGNRHPILTVGAYLLYSSISSIFCNPEKIPTDYGSAEATIDPKTGELVRIIQREANNDTTYVKEKK